MGSVVERWTRLLLMLDGASFSDDFLSAIRAG